MTLSSAGFPGSVTDIDWSRLISLISYDGTDGMAVSPNAGDRTVRISSGWSNVGGILAKNDSNLVVGPLPANTGSLARLDRIILRANWSNKTLTATYRQGTPSSNPQPPALTRNPGSQYEVSLAQVRIEPGQGAIATADVFHEATPPIGGFFNINGIRKAPHPDRGSLIWYQAAESLRVVHDGEYIEIANARSEMLPDQAFSDSNFTYTSSTPAPTATGAGSVGRSFTAPPSGMVFVSITGRIQSNIDGNLALLGWELRTGATLGSGSIRYAANANRAVIAGEAVNTNAPSVNNATNRFLATGLTPAAVYNARAMHWSSSSGKTSQFWSRNLVIEPV